MSHFLKDKAAIAGIGLTEFSKKSGVSELPGEGIEAQTREALSRVQTLLESVGSDKSRMLQVIIWLKSMEHFNAMNEIWEEWVPEGAAPARACGQSALASDDLLVEFTVTAAL